jgi:glyoxylase-like metal-dependent hydrolase (beta-lactamase superfamily II)
MTLVVEQFLTSRGDRIYRIPLELFPGFWGYSHVVVADSLCCLVDVGSGLESSNACLETGMQSIRQEHGESIDWRRLTHIVISHGHIDHHGGLKFVQGRTAAPVGIHELDWRVVACYEARLAEAVEALQRYLGTSGLALEEQTGILEIYGVHKGLFASVSVDFTFTSPCSTLGPLTITHTPGHCPGQVIIQVDDILLCGDQVLSDISPHQSPEQLTPYTGLGHYLESLGLVEQLAPKVRLALGGHQRAMPDLAGRVQAIRAGHQTRLWQVLQLTEQPASLAQIAQALFPEADGYNRLLALEEAGAHVEYLFTRGYLNCVPPDSTAVAPGGLRYQAQHNRPIPVLPASGAPCASIESPPLPAPMS